MQRKRIFFIEATRIDSDHSLWVVLPISTDSTKFSAEQGWGNVRFQYLTANGVYSKFVARTNQWRSRQYSLAFDTVILEP